MQKNSIGVHSNILNFILHSSGNGKNGQQTGETLPNHSQRSGQQNGQSQDEKAGTSSTSGDPTASSSGPAGAPGHHKRIMTEEPSSLSGKMKGSLSLYFSHIFKMFINAQPIIFCRIFRGKHIPSHVEGCRLSCNKMHKSKSENN